MIPHNQKSVAFVNLISLSVFVLLLVAVTTGTDILLVDRFISETVSRYAGPGIIAIATFFTRLGDFFSIVIISGIAIGYFRRKKRLERAIVIATTLVTSDLFV